MSLSHMQIIGNIDDQSILEQVPSLLKKTGAIYPIDLSIHVEMGSFTINVKTETDLDYNPQMELLKETISLYLEENGIKYFVAEDQLKALMAN